MPTGVYEHIPADFTHRISVCVTPKMKAALEDRAAGFDSDKATLIRGAINFLEHVLDHMDELPPHLSQELACLIELSSKQDKKSKARLLDSVSYNQAFRG